jgi:hypothetical protein
MIRRLALLLVLLLPSVVGAHEVRPAYLELREEEGSTWQVLWKVPTRGEWRLSLEPRFPDGCNAVGERTSWDVDAAQTSRWALHCSGGLAGGRLEILGLPATMTDVLVRIAPAGGAVANLRLTPGEPAGVLGADGSSWQRAATYLRLGVEHILLGFDHLLFVLGLLLLVRGWGRLIGTITAFTAAHSISLALATFGLVIIRLALVEALIALSIVFVAVETVRAQRGEAGITAHWPWLVAFAFGLLHGLGFASALGEIGLPAGDIPLALLLFNVGVELGQLLFIAACFAVWWPLRDLARERRWAPLVPAYAIGSLAAFWFISRATVLIA